MKKFLLTVLAFLSFGAYSHIMGQTTATDTQQKNPDLKTAGKYTGSKKAGTLHGQGV